MSTDTAAPVTPDAAVASPALFAFDDARLLDLARRHPTPAFVHSRGIARERFQRLRAALPPRVRLAYAVKANPAPELLAVLAAEGAWFDCASAGEVAAITTAGARGGQAVFAGPAKSEEDLAAAHGQGLRVQVDGIEDVERLAARHRASAATEPLAVNVRVHPLDGVTEGSPIIGGSGPSAFGVDEEDLADFLHAAARHPEVRIAGVQVFSAGNERDAATLLANHATALRIARTVGELTGAAPDLIDLGGGLGIPYADDETELDVEALGRGLAELLAEHPWFTGHLLLEPGRWLAGPTGVLLTRVVRRKRSRGVDLLMLDSGINHLIRPLLTGQPFPARAPGRAGAAQRVTLAGPLCTSLDRLGDVDLPDDVVAGDVLVLGQVGAYGATEAMTHFLSRTPAAQHWVD